MYADDLIMLSDSPTGLQNYLDRLKNYTEQWKLEINLSKTKIMIFQRSGRTPKTTFFFGD